MARLLVVEDEAMLLHSLTRGLEEEGHHVTTATTGKEGLQLARSEVVDAVVLDLMLSDGDGLHVISSLREQGFTKPILIVTARDGVDDRIVGLDTGGDDYLVKPFVFNELLARLRALLRRDVAGREPILRFADLELNSLTRAVLRNGIPVELTQRQFQLLEYLMRHVNQTVTRDMIARDVWKETTSTWTNVIEVHINQLRKRIERPEAPLLLHTIRGQGYLLGERP